MEKLTLRLFRMVAAAGLLYLLPAHATLAIPTLFLNDGMGNTGSMSSASGVVTFNGAVGNFTLNITTGVTQPVIGSATSPMLSLNSVNVTGTPGGTLTIMFSDIFYGPFSGTFASHVGGTITSNGSIAYSTFADAGNVLFGMGTSLTHQGSFSTSSYSDDATSALALNSFSLTQMVVITLDANGVASFGATLSGTPQTGIVAAVPEGGSTLAFLGVSLVIIELVRRKVVRSLS